MIIYRQSNNVQYSLILYAADRTKLAIARPRSPSSYGIFAYDGNLMGGALIGLGMAFTGACPGTALIQATVGLESGMLVTLGGLFGGIAFSVLQPMLSAKEEPSATSQTRNNTTTDEPTSAPEQSKFPTLATALGVDPALVLTLWIPFCLMILYLAVSSDPSLRSIGNAGLLIAPVYSGITIGLAQAASMLLNGHAIGVSGAYADVGSWAAQILPKRSAQAKTLVTPAVTFAVGMMIGAAALIRVTFPGGVVGESADLSVLRALGGGFAMIFGARLAGGCTSGHAITGMATFSIASFVTAGAMFAAGIAGAAAAA